MDPLLLGREAGALAAGVAALAGAEREDIVIQQNAHADHEQQQQQEDELEEEEEEDEEEEEEEDKDEDEDRMNLSPQERAWALAIKEAIENDSNLESLSDFKYVQIALVDEGNVEAALERARHLQYVREEYRLQDTFEEGKRLLRWFLSKAHPGHLMDFFYSKNMRQHVVVMDIAKQDTRTFNTTPEDYKANFAAAHHCHNCHCPDFQSIRDGFMFLLESSHYQWKAPNMMSFKSSRRLMQDVDAVYPYRLNRLQMVNAGVLANTLASLLKAVLPKNVSSKFSTQDIRDELWLDRVCLVPTLEAATERTLQVMIESLQRRYQNEEEFRL